MCPNQRIILKEHVLDIKIKQQLEDFLLSKLPNISCELMHFFMCDFHKQLMARGLNKTQQYRKWDDMH